jgi:hypothetical protein
MAVVLSGYEKEAMVHLDSTGILATVQGRLPEKVTRVFETILEELQMKVTTRKYRDIYVNEGILWGTQR